MKLIKNKKGNEKHPLEDEKLDSISKKTLKLKKSSKSLLF